MLKRQDGITLVALVITIIVLLILAGVTLSLLFGEGGILQYAQEGAENYTNAAYAENEMLEHAENFIENYLQSTNPPATPATPATP